MPCVRVPGGILSFVGDYEPGDQPPTGYMDWHEWAMVQHKAGLRQARCCRCSRLKFSQELSWKRVDSEATDCKGCVFTFRLPVCNECAWR